MELLDDILAQNYPRILSVAHSNLKFYYLCSWRKLKYENQIWVKFNLKWRVCPDPDVYKVYWQQINTKKTWGATWERPRTKENKKEGETGFSFKSEPNTMMYPLYSCLCLSWMGFLMYTKVPYPFSAQNSFPLLLRETRLEAAIELSGLWRLHRADPPPLTRVSGPWSAASDVRSCVQMFWLLTAPAPGIYCVIVMRAVLVIRDLNNTPLASILSESCFLPPVPNK